MTEKKLGGQTAALAYPPVLAGWANVVGQKEGAGPLGRGPLPRNSGTFSLPFWSQKGRSNDKKPL